MNYRMWSLEDGERVIRLRGASKKASLVPGVHRSDLPHAGTWSNSESYALIPSRRGVRLRVRRALQFEPRLTDRSADDAVLLLGPHDAIHRLISSGPSWCRALSKRSAPSDQADRMTAHRFKPKSLENS